MNNTFEEKMLAFADKYEMLSEKSRVVAAVSGGADSVSMLIALKAVSEKRGLLLSAAHYNHCLRGEESDGDEKFVAELCKRLGVPCVFGRGDVSGEAEKTGESIETAARRLRYDFLRSAAGGALIATAHNADDNAETVIMNLIRGAGTRGMSGIPPVRGDIIRPMLVFTRSDIEDYLREKGEKHREDSTNACDDYTRNLIRHRVMPVLRGVNGNMSGAVLRASELLREDDEYLCAVAERFTEENYSAGRIKAERLASAPKPVASRAVRKIIGEGLSEGHVNAVLALSRAESPSAEVNLPHITVRREYGDVVFGKAEGCELLPAVISENGDTVLSTGLHIRCEKCTFSPNVHKSFNTFIFKCEDICGKITVRPRKTGDKLTLGGCTKTLKKLFIEKKIPEAVRCSTPVFEDERRILAVGGIGQTPSGNLSAGAEVLIIKIGDCGYYE